MPASKIAFTHDKSPATSKRTLTLHVFTPGGASAAGFTHGPAQRAMLSHLPTGQPLGCS